MSAQSPRPTESDGAGSRMTRRGLFKRAAVAGGTMVALPVGVDRFAPRYSPIGRAAAIPLAPILIGGYAVGHFLYNNVDWGGGDDSADAINEARANELHDSIYLTGTEMQMTQAPMLESLAGDVSMLRQICRSDAAFALMQAASDEKSESNATDDGKAAVEDAVANVEANFFDAWSSQMTKIHTRAGLVANSDVLGFGSVFGWLGAGNPQPSPSWINAPDGSLDHEVGVELVNGDSHTVTVTLGLNDEAASTGDHGDIVLVPWSSVPSLSSFSGSLRYGDPADPWTSYQPDNNGWGPAGPGTWGTTIKDRESADTVDVLNATEWWTIHNELKTLLAEEKANVETMVSTFYQDALNGEIPFHEMASASAILNAADSLENWKQAAGAYRAMMMPEAEDPAVIELPNGVQLEGLLFWSEPDSENGLPVGETILIDNTIGRLYMAAEIRSVPEPPESELHSVTLTAVDDDTDATALEGITVEMKGSDSTWTTDANGEVTLEASEGPTTFYLNGADGGGTSHDTGITVEITAENTSFSIVHDGSDKTSLNADPFSDQTLTQDNVGDVVIPSLTQDFEVVGVHERPDASNLMFEEPDRVQPDDDFQTYVDNSKDAGDDLEETREETTTIVIENTGSGPGPLFPGGNPLEGSGGLLGLGIIGVVIMLVIGFVTDMIPGMGN